MDSRLFCCVDGGASNTRVALYDTSGNRLGLSVGGPTSLTLRGAEAWQEILAVLENVARAVSLEGDYLAQTHFGIGLAGANNTRQRDLFMAAAPSAGGLRVSTDAYIAALGAHGAAPGGCGDRGNRQCRLPDRGRGAVSACRWLGVPGW